MPVTDTATKRRINTGQIYFRIVLPFFLAAECIERDNAVVGCAEIQCAANCQRRCLKRGGTMRIGGAGEITVVIGPCDGEIFHVVGCNLVECCETLACGVAAYDGPLGVVGEGVQRHNANQQN
jgi:hypothetical protein